jgi:hypothetical protein
MSETDFVVDRNGVVTDVRNRVWPVSSSTENAPIPWHVTPLVFLVPIPVGLILMILEMLVRSHGH